MPNLDTADNPMLTALHNAFGALESNDVVDIVTIEDNQEQEGYEVQADEWTLFVEGWPMTTAWIAIDEDVAGPEQFRTALESTLDEQDLEAMQSLDAELGGELATILAGSGDGLSIALAAMIAADVEG